MGPANETITTTRLMVFTCPTASPNAPLEEVTSHNYGCNYGNTDIYADPILNGVVFARAPFDDIGADPTNPSSGTLTVNFAQITDGASNTILAAELVQGQGPDLRGFSPHWLNDVGQPDIDPLPSLCLMAMDSQNHLCTGLQQ
jgi:Protein of unknown function (DUF1559)